MTKIPELTSVLNEFRQITGISLDVSSFEGSDSQFAANQLKKLCTAYREKYDKTHFLQSILRKEFTDYEISEHAGRLHIDIHKIRVLFLLETNNALDNTILSVLKSMFPSQSGTYLFSVSDQQLALLYPLSEQELHELDLTTLALSISDTLNMEALASVKIAYAPCIKQLSELSDAYSKASLALKIGKLFSSEQTIFSYDQLSTGRLIYHLPVSVCHEFLNEIFKDDVPDALEPELFLTINRFFQNNLNIAETARQLHMHRNTLIYRIEQIEKRTGLDLRNFEDAMTFKIALMVMNYIEGNTTADSVGSE